MADQQRVTLPDGTVQTFPNDATPEQIAAALGVKPPEARSLGGDLADVGKGFAKGAGRLGYDIVRQLNPALSLTLPPRDPTHGTALNPTNLRQSQGMAGFDVASVVPTGLASAGSRFLPRVAEAIAAKPFPGIARAAIRRALDLGAGAISRRSAVILAKEAKATPVLTEVPKWKPVVAKGPAAKFGRGEWGYEVVKSPSKMQPLADAMKTASSVPLNLTVRDMIQLTGRGMLGTQLIPGNQLLGGAIGAGTYIARSPRATSALAQGMYSLAPSAQAAAGSSSAFLLRLLAGGGR